ncbi:MAG: hypothetical protein ABIY51_13205 [Ferruginibacter sp.]
METILVKPRNKEEYNLVAELMQRMKIPVATAPKKKLTAKQKAKAIFLDSFEGRLNEVKLHGEGKIKLNSWDEVYKEL